MRKGCGWPTGQTAALFPARVPFTQALWSRSVAGPRDLGSLQPFLVGLQKVVSLHKHLRKGSNSPGQEKPSASPRVPDSGLVSLYRCFWQGWQGTTEQWLLCGLVLTLCDWYILPQNLGVSLHGWCVVMHLWPGVVAPGIP